MRNKIYFNSAIVISALGTFGLGLPLFRYLSYNPVFDMFGHALFVVKSVTNNTFPFPFIYPFTIYLFAGFSINVKLLLESSAIVLSLALTAKYLLTVRLFLNLSQNNLYSYGIIIICIGLLLCSPISWSVNQMYLGKTTPNVWHNPTTIMAMPFVILLFRSIVKFLQEDEIEKFSVVNIIVFSVLNIATKPSFVFVVIPALPLGVVLYQKKWSANKIVAGVLISFFLLLLIFLAYYMIYELEKNPQEGKSGVAIELFRIWFLYGYYYYPLHIISGLIFPIAYCTLFFSSVKEDKLLQFTLLLYLIALLISAVFVETGPRASHGNLTWQVPMTGYLLFTVVSIRMVENMRKTGWVDKKNKITFATFVLHCVYGVLYIIKIVLMKNYY
ncbi:MAG: hypothetical protein RMJ44_00575 [Cytophagales bacterium]|nr:hypothetical protein [Bernardetiaceae bacterium]MDW8209553.1 hypothetical protein [Cytophagales bacterium]